jgi:hypothetical protein
MTGHNKDMRQDRQPQGRDDGLNNQSDARNRANQQAASRPGVDADNELDERGAMTSTPHEGSAYQPLRAGSDEQRQRADDSAYVLDQDAGTDDGAGVSRRGAMTQHGDARRETDPAPGGGSVYQPLSDDPRNLEDAGEKQRRNPAGQNQQGLHESGPGEQIRERHDDERRDETPRGMPGEGGPRP